MYPHQPPDRSGVEERVLSTDFGRWPHLLNELCGFVWTPQCRMESASCKCSVQEYAQGRVFLTHRNFVVDGLVAAPLTATTAALWGV